MTPLSEIFRQMLSRLFIWLMVILFILVLMGGVVNHVFQFLPTSL